MATITLRTARDVLTIDGETGALIGLSPLGDPQTNLLTTPSDAPAFVVQYLDGGHYVVLDSRQAEMTVERGEMSVSSASMEMVPAVGRCLSSPSSRVDSAKRRREGEGDRGGEEAAAVRRSEGPNYEGALFAPEVSGPPSAVRRAGPRG